MPRRIEDRELEELLRSASEIDSYDYEGEGADDYFSAFLYQLPDGRHFRNVQSSGFNSQFNGAGDVAEWLDEEEVAQWSVFE